MGRNNKRTVHGSRRIGIAVVAAALVVVLAAPAGASAATVAQARGQLLSWHLNPAPLFPAPLPSALTGADVKLSRFTPLDYDVSFTKPGCTGPFCVDLRRLGYNGLNDILNDPVTSNVRLLQIGNRSVYAAETGHAGAPGLMAWHEQGRTYMAITKDEANIDDVIRVLTPFVASLQPLTEPCAALTFISVRGSGESSKGTDDQSASAVTQRVYSETLSRLAKVVPKPGFYQLPYAALSVNVIANGVGKGSLLGAKRRLLRNVKTYINGEKQGVKNLSNFVSDTKARCSNAGFLLAGYSQGAMVIHDYLTQLARNGRSRELLSIRGVVLVADPERAPDSHVINFGSARASDYGVCRASEKVQQPNVCTGTDSTQDVPSVFPNIWQVCDDGDIVCDTSALLHANTLSGWKAQVKGGTITHETYCVTGRHGSRCTHGLITAGRGLGQRASTAP